MIKFESLPYEPLRITSRFGPRNTGIKGASTDHKGVDLGADRSKYKSNTDGGPVRAVLPYIVKASYYNNLRGWVVLLDHGEGLQTLYQHLKAKGLPVGVRGDAGSIIGIMGNTGVGAQLHLHFEVRINGKPVDPEPYLKGVEEELSEEYIKKIIDKNDPIYRKPSDLPSWAQPTINRYIKEGYINPEPDGSINLRLSMVRMIIIMDRRLG